MPPVLELLAYLISSVSNVIKKNRRNAESMSSRIAAEDSQAYGLLRRRGLLLPLDGDILDVPIHNRMAF
jgi:hypothetical protein